MNDIKQLRILANSPITEQAIYCDQICAKLIQEQQTVMFKKWMRDDDHFQQWNLNSIGNVAAIAHYTDDEECRQLSLDKLYRYKEWVNTPQCIIL